MSSNYADRLADRSGADESPLVGSHPRLHPAIEWVWFPMAGLSSALHASSEANFPIRVAIALCIAQSGLFSGLNLAVFSVSRLRLEVEAANGNPNAIGLLGLRRDSNLILATILWGNVATNVLLTLLSGSVLTGIAAFVFSTIVITFLGDIIPQAYFSRNALRVAGWFTPLLELYRIVLFPIAKPTAMFLNWWLGPEGINLLRERDFRAFMMKHVETTGTEVGQLEAIGALNFLDLDDIPVVDEGEPVESSQYNRSPR